MRLDSHFIKQVIPHAEIQGPELVDLSFCIDSRMTQPGDLFVALPGQQVNGHAYLRHAIDQGVAGLMIMKTQEAALGMLTRQELDRLLIIRVAHTHDALIEIARAWRAQFSIPIIGITGSVGKTSTKELLGEMIREGGKNCLISQGNQNTVLGASLNILRMRSHHESAVFEMGINKRGEMALMAALIKPTIGVITMIGHSHMEGLGSLQDIASEKRDIFKFFKEDNIGIINGDQTILSHMSYSHPLIRFGYKTSNQVQARKIQLKENAISFALKIYTKKYQVVVPTHHEGRIMQVLAATAAAHLIGIDDATIVRVIEKPFVVARRFELRTLRNKQGALIDDCYNASPESMKAALLAFERIESAQPKIAVLGDMLELGVTSQFWHRQLGRFLRKSPTINKVIFVGEHSKLALKTMPLHLHAQVVRTWQEARQLLESYLDKKPLILVKGSRGMQLDQLVNNLCE